MSPTRKADGTGGDYLAKRSRNNAAVRRSREKARMKAKDTNDRVSILKQENEMLEERIKLLTKELTFLKDIFLAHAGKNLNDFEVCKSLLSNSFVPFPFQIQNTVYQLMILNSERCFKKNHSLRMTQNYRDNSNYCFYFFFFYITIKL